MMKMFVCAGAGALVGTVFGGLVAGILDRPGMNPAPIALFIAIAAPIGSVTGAIFGAVSVLQEEFSQVHREIREMAKNR